MIYDRTPEDVENALQIRSEKVMKGISLNQEEKKIMERGFLTVNTLNRIESKISELASLFLPTAITARTWTNSDMFGFYDFQRILENLKVLVNACYSEPNRPALPDMTYHFTTFNIIEKILHDIDTEVK